MAGLVRSRTNEYKTIPAPGGMTGEQASSVYQGFYGEMPVLATDYATSTTALRSLEVVPSTPNSASNASIVNRANRRNGTISTSGTEDFPEITPQYPPYVESSKFQPKLLGPLVNYVLNACLYRAGYPAASVMNGGLHNLALSTRVDQLPTRISGGPGPAAMTTSQRRFQRVQNIPRFSTMPQQYKTQSTSG